MGFRPHRAARQLGPSNTQAFLSYTTPQCASQFLFLLFLIAEATVAYDSHRYHLSDYPEARVVSSVMLSNQDMQCTGGVLVWVS